MCVSLSLFLPLSLSYQVPTYLPESIVECLLKVTFSSILILFVIFMNSVMSIHLRSYVTRVVYLI